MPSAPKFLKFWIKQSKSNSKVDKISHDVCPKTQEISKNLSKIQQLKKFRKIYQKVSKLKKFRKIFLKVSKLKKFQKYLKKCLEL